MGDFGGRKGKGEILHLYSIRNRQKAPYPTKSCYFGFRLHFIYRVEIKFRFPSPRGAGNLLIPDQLPLKT